MGKNGRSYAWAKQPTHAEWNYLQLLFDQAATGQTVVQHEPGQIWPFGEIRSFYAAGPDTNVLGFR